MARMYDVNTVNAAMMQAAEICREKLPEGDKLKKVLACFAGMESVEAEPVVHANWQRREHPIPGLVSLTGVMRCTACRQVFRRITNMVRFEWCPRCGAKMDGGSEW